MDVPPTVCPSPAPPSVTVSVSSEHMHLETLPIKSEPADRPPPAPLLPPASFPIAEAQQSESTTFSSAAVASPPLDVVQPSSVAAAAVNSPSQDVAAAFNAPKPLEAMRAAAQDMQPSTASSRTPPSAVPCVQPTLSPHPTAPTAAASASYSIQLVLPAAAVTHVAPTLPYAASLINGVQSATALFSASPAHFAASQHHHTLASAATTEPLASPSLPHCPTTLPPAIPPSSTSPLPPQHGSFSSPAAMEQVLIFLLNEVSDLKRTIRTMQDEKEEKRRKKREKEARRQEEEENERRQRVEAEERKEAETAGTTDEVAEERKDDSGDNVETEKRKKKKKRQRAESEVDEDQPGSQAEEGREIRKKERKKKDKQADTVSATSDRPEVSEPVTERPREKEKQRKQKQKAHSADPLTSTSSIAAVTSSSSSSLPNSSTASARPTAATTAIVEPSTESRPMLRIGFSGAPPSSAPTTVSTVTSDLPSTRPRSSGRSLLRPEPPSHTAFMPQPPPPPTRPTTVAPATAPLTPTTLTACPASPSTDIHPLPPPATTLLVSVDQNGAVSQLHYSGADADMDDMPSLERVGDDEMDGRVEVIHSPAVSAVRQEHGVIDLSDESSPMEAQRSISTTATTPSASSAALPNHSPSLHPISSSASPAVSSSSSSSSSTSVPPSAPPPSLLQQEVTNKKSKLALLAAQQKAAKQKAEEETAERRKQAEMAAARWAAEEQKKKEIAWLRREIARKEAEKSVRDKERDKRQREREKEKTRLKRQQAKYDKGQHVPAAVQQQQQRQKSNEAGRAGDGSRGEGGHGSGEHRDENGTPPPLGWFEDRRGENDH